MKRRLTAIALLFIALSFAGNIYADQESNKYERQLTKLNRLLKLNSFNLEDDKRNKVDEWETSYVFSYSKGKLLIDYDEETHYYSNKELTSSFVYKGRYEVDPKLIDASTIQCLNNSSNAMVNVLCQKKGCVKNEFTSIDYGKDKIEKYKRENYKKKSSGFNINVRTVSIQDEVIELLKELVTASK